MLNLIWDLDGTLIDSQKEVLESLYLAINDAGLKKERIIKPFRVGPTIDKIIKESFSAEELKNEVLENAVKAFRNRYDNSDFVYTLAFEGIDDILKNNDYINYVITNKPDKPTNRIVKKLVWNGFIKKIITPYTYNSSVKMSKTELFKSLIETEKLDKMITYGIGDMATDYVAAENNGLKTIGVLWGTGTAEELKKCTYVCKTVNELSLLLGKL